MKEYKDLIIDSVHWFSGRDSIGIILCTDKITNEKKAYMGLASGVHEGRDTIAIIEYGQKLSEFRITPIVELLKSSK